MCIRDRLRAGFILHPTGPASERPYAFEGGPLNFGPRPPWGQKCFSPIFKKILGEGSKFSSALYGDPKARQGQNFGNCTSAHFRYADDFSYSPITFAVVSESGKTSLLGVMVRGLQCPKRAPRSQNFKIFTFLRDHCAKTLCVSGLEPALFCTPLGPLVSAPTYLRAENRLFIELQECCTCQKSCGDAGLGPR